MLQYKENDKMVSCKYTITKLLFTKRDMYYLHSCSFATVGLHLKAALATISFSSIVTSKFIQVYLIRFCFLFRVYLAAEILPRGHS